MKKPDRSPTLRNRRLDDWRVLVALLRPPPDPTWASKRRWYRSRLQRAANMARLSAICRTCAIPYPAALHALDGNPKYSNVAALLQVPVREEVVHRCLKMVERQLFGNTVATFNKLRRG